MSTAPACLPRRDEQVIGHQRKTAEERDEEDGVSQQPQEDEAPAPKTKKAKGKRTGVLTPSAANALHF
eukprot:scaffold34735_cov72-Phaeocystis_antarctica.AAC.1